MTVFEVLVLCPVAVGAWRATRHTIRPTGVRGGTPPALAGCRERYQLETESSPQVGGDWLYMGVRCWRQQDRVGAWRPAELIARRVTRVDDPVEIGSARAELERVAELANQTAWALAEARQPLRWRARRRTWRGGKPKYLYAVDSGVRAGERHDRIDLGVHVWHYLGPLDGWRRVAILKAVSVDADDLVTFGEARAELQAFAEEKNRELREAG